MGTQIRPMGPGEHAMWLAADAADRTVHELTEEDLKGLRRYIEDRKEPGSFIRAVLENDLTRAVGQADLRNRRRIFEYVEWLYNEAPGTCWGSPEKVQRWLAGK